MSGANDAGRERFTGPIGPSPGTDERANSTPTDSPSTDSPSTDSSRADPPRSGDPAPQPPTAESSDHVVGSRYRIGELIGRGGMADVRIGLDEKLGRPVAIKLLRPDLARDPRFQSRFRQEAQAVASLNHPNIVGTFDTGEEETTDRYGQTVQAPWIAMEYVQGRTLRELSTAGQLSTDRVVELGSQVLSALEYSHERGIVHRDIKPANVMVTDDDDVKVMDFGIARAVEDSSASLTQTQAVLGTAAYLSPEQARGERVDSRSDLYSTACMIYEMLVGRPPFHGDSAVSVAYQHVREMPALPSAVDPAVSPALDSVLSHALEKHRQDRFQDAAAFRAALIAAADGEVYTPIVGGVGESTQEMPPEDATMVVPAVPRSATSASDAASASEDKRKDSQATGPAAAVAPAAAPPASAVPPTAGASASPRRKRRRGWVLPLVVLGLLGLAVGAFFAVQAFTDRPFVADTVAVPAVESMSQADGERVIREAGLNPQAEPRPSDVVEEGTAIGTDPGANTAVDPGSDVTLLVSTGPEMVTVPKDLAGQPSSVALKRLRELGLEPQVTTNNNHPKIPADAVIETNPALGSEVRVGSQINIALSTGKVVMPQLVGMSEAQARAILAGDDLQLPVTIRQATNSVVAPGTVTSQSAPARTDIDAGTTITLTVAAAPAPPPAAPEPTQPAPEPTKEPEPAPSPAPSE